jgi:hypothetical protein
MENKDVTEEDYIEFIKSMIIDSAEHPGRTLILTSYEAKALLEYIRLIENGQDTLRVERWR